jgi:hypothetical protein
MSIEFLRSSHHIFRNERPSDDFCFHEFGLFPSVNADSKAFSLLGVLVAKAMSLEITLELNFNPVFFDLARGLPVSLTWVDRRLAAAFAAPEGLYGLDFTYPGHPDIELIQGGESVVVTPENTHLYMNALELATCSGNVKTCVDAFVHGFCRVLPFAALDLFTSREISCLVHGTSELITADDLENYFMISHGYTRESPQIEMLFQVIVEMDATAQRDFICFVTGVRSLPVGGLRALSPRMTVMCSTGDGQNPDSDLPTASTCSYLLKLPRYSSKTVLKCKLQTAITDGLNSFDLS